MCPAKRLAIALVASLATGCFITANDPPPPDRIVAAEPTNPRSTLTVRWTIAGAADPVECQRRLTPTLGVRVYDTSAREVGAWQEACESFATSITLDAGTYSARAALLDADQRPRTTEAEVARFSLFGGDEVITNVEFPADSFHPERAAPP